MKILSILCLALLLSACNGDPHDTRVPTDISTWSKTVRPSLMKLTTEEKTLFSQYAIRHSMGAADGHIGSPSDPIPADLTIGQAIAEQRDYMAHAQGK